MTDDVLLVENDVLVAERLANALICKGCNVSIYNSGTDAFVAMNDIAPWLIIVAEHLPDMSGHDLLEGMGNRRADKMRPFSFMILAHGLDRQVQYSDFGPDVYINRHSQAQEFMAYVRHFRPQATRNEKCG